MDVRATLFVVSAQGGSGWRWAGRASAGALALLRVAFGAALVRAFARAMRGCKPTYHAQVAVAVVGLCATCCQKGDANGGAVDTNRLASSGAAPFASPSASSKPPPANRFIEWTAGLQLRWHETPSFTALVARFDLERFELVSAPASTLSGEARLTLRQLGHRVPFVVGVNGGFFDGEGRPLGLRVTRNRLLVQLRQADWGIFYQTRDGVYLEHTEQVDRRRLTQARFAIQCGPRIIVSGRALKLKPSKHRRSVLGFDAQQRVVLLATASLVDLNVLAQNLARPESAGGLGLLQALALDGGPSTGFVVKRATPGFGVSGASAPVRNASPESEHFRIFVQAPVADAVFVVPKGAQLWLDDVTHFPPLAEGLSAGFGAAP